MKTFNAKKSGFSFKQSLSFYDINAKVGVDAAPSSATSVNIDNIGFRPKLVMPFMSGSAEGSTSHARFGFGAFDGTNSYSISTYSTTGLTTTDTGRRHSSKIIDRLENAGPTELSADLFNLNNNGFSLNWSAVRSGHLFNHINIGGKTFEAKLTQHQMNSTGADQSFTHGLSDAPTALIIFMSPHITTTATTAAEMQLSIGAFAAGQQWATALYSRNAVTTSTCRRCIFTDRIAIDLDIISPQKCMVIKSVNKTHFNVSYLNSTNEQWVFHVLAIRGCRAKVGTFDCNGSLSPLNIDAGFIPKLFIPVFIPSGLTSVNSVLSTISLSIGASDGTNNVSCGIYDADSATTTNTRRNQSSSTLSQYDSNGNVTFAATARFNNKSVIITPTVNAAIGWGQGTYIILGA